MSEPCPSPEELAKMLAGASNSGSVELHIATCPLCQNVLEELTSDDTIQVEPSDPQPEGESKAEAEPIRFLDRLARNPPWIGAKHAEAGETLLTSELPAHSPPATLPRIPNYVVMEELGRGGMGVVYRAVEVQLKRVVALKMLLPGAQASTELVARFWSEAETVARVRHPNVVDIHAVGMHEGHPFLEMEYVAGGSLSSRLDGTPWTARDASALVEALARGVEEVHRLGVVHRDVKPGNVLMGPDGTPKLGDFGLAKLLEADSRLTRTGAVLGTPSYMAPEQAESSEGSVEPSADIYALGAIYYELLTGRPPFKGPTVMETLRQVRFDDPVPPSRLVPRLPRDAETIALKCLEKPPSRRYASAGALADDLRRYLEDRPILARPLGPTGRLLRFCQRSPVLAGLAAAVVLLLVAVTAVSLTAALRLAAAASQERRAKYFSDMNLVQQAWEANDTRRMNELLGLYARGRGRDDLRGFEWAYWWRLGHLYQSEFNGHTGRVLLVAFSPDGSKVASLDSEHALLLWDRESRRIEARREVTKVLRVIAFSPDGKTLIGGGDDGFLTVWDPALGRSEVLEGATERVVALAFRGPRTLLSAHESDIVRTWDLDSKKTTRIEVGPPLPVSKISGRDYLVPHAFTRDGRTLAVAGPDGTILVRPTDSSRPEDSWTFKIDETTPGIGDGGSEVVELPGRSLAFSPDGALLAIGGEDFTASVWDLAARREIARLRGHTAPIWSLGFLPGGKRLATSSYDNTVMIWDVASGRLEAHLKGHGGVIPALAISPDGRTLASASEDGTVKLWGLDQRDVGLPLGGHGGGVNAIAYGDGPQGPRLAAASRDGRLTLWDATTGRRLASVAAQPAGSVDGQSQLRAVVYSPDGRLLISGGFDGPVRLWDAKTLALAGELTTSHPKPSYETLVVSPDGSLVAAGSRWPTIEIWDLPNRVQLASFPSGALALAFSPDSSKLAVAHPERVSLYDVAEIRRTGVLRAEPILQGQRIDALAFSPDGSSLAAGGRDGTISLLDPGSGPPGPRSAWRAHSNRITSLAFSPDGRTLASGGRDNTIRLWDAAERKLKSTLKGHTRNVMSIAFSTDGRTLASGSLDGTARLWFAPDPG